MRVRELYTNYQLYVLFFLPRMRLRPTIDMAILEPPLPENFL